MKELIEWKNLTNFEIEKLDKDISLVIPIGSVEAHGSHLSMDNDNIIAQFLAKQLCLETGSIYGIPITIGNTEKLVDFPGSLNVRDDVLKEYLKDILNSYLRAGFRKIFIVNGHKGNNAYIQDAIKKIELESIGFIFYKDIIADELDETYLGNHSNRLETELAMLAKKEMVYLDKAKNNFVENRELIRQKFDRKIMPNCVDGYPEKANLESAQGVFDTIIKKLKSILVDIN